jgi:hypothetical protein
MRKEDREHNTADSFGNEFGNLPNFHSGLHLTVDHPTHGKIGPFKIPRARGIEKLADPWAATLSLPLRVHLSLPIFSLFFPLLLSSSPEHRSSQLSIQSHRHQSAFLLNSAARLDGSTIAGGSGGCWNAAKKGGG